jgi:galacturan 1,4-alpha-galacturonidase
VRRLRVANCTIAGAANGVRIKTWRGGFEDIVMRKVRNPVIIDQEYCPYASCPESARTTRRSLARRNRFPLLTGVVLSAIVLPVQEMSPSAVRISDVKFKNIRGVSATRVAVKLSCSEANPCRGLELRDIHLRYVRRGVATQSRCAHVGGTLVPPSCIWDCSTRNCRIEMGKR